MSQSASQSTSQSIDHTDLSDPIKPTNSANDSSIEAPIATTNNTKINPRSAMWQTKLQDPTLAALADYTPRDLARALLEQLSVDERDWHRLKGDRRVRAREQVAAALVFMLADNNDEARQRLEHALDWIDRRVSAPPCPDHGSRPNNIKPTQNEST
jgi:hypothetical protein